MNAAPESESAGADPRLRVWVALLFFFSGAAGLVYQVLWMRSLGLFFGSDMLGVSIILGTFMGGLALGSAVGGRIAERVARPLLGYGLAELGIGAFALAVRPILDVLDPLLQALFSSGGDGLAYQATRVVISASVLLVPTAAMGATLPLVLRHFVQKGSEVGALTAFFYAINTIGALFGTLVAGFVLLPYLGMAKTTLAIAALNGMIGAICIALAMRPSSASSMITAIAKQSPPLVDPSHEEREVTLSGLDAAPRERLARAALVAVAFSGLGSFALEVVWTRVLLMSVSGTVYAFTAMLACVLLGIFLGSGLVANVVDHHPRPAALFARLEIFAGIAVAALALLARSVPGLFSSLLAGFASMTSGDHQAALNAATLFTSFLYLAIPTTLIGATLPVALRIYTLHAGQIGSRAGNLYAANTAGSIVGSLSAGLLMLPLLGTTGSLALIALLFVSVGSYLWIVDAETAGGPRRPLIPILALGLSAALCGTALMLPYRIVLNFNQRVSPDTEVLFHAEGIQNTIDVTRSPSGTTSLIIGGNVEADDGLVQRRHFVLKGHLPLLFLDEPSDTEVLVVGLGMGITLASTARHPGVERVDVVELSPEILEAQSHLASVNGDVVNSPNVHIRIDDGRSVMKRTSKRYDMITADPIHPKISRVGYLYTQEYYESIRERLRDGGVVCQWMPLYQISPSRLRSAMKTFAAVFPEATLWYVENHALFLARKGSFEIDYPELVARLSDPAVREDLSSIGIESPEELLSLFLLGPEDLGRFLEAEPDTPLNTDDHPYLEYFVPGDLFYRPVDNVRELLRFASNPAQHVRHMPPNAARRLEALVEERPRRILSQLERP